MYCYKCKRKFSEYRLTYTPPDETWPSSARYCWECVDPDFYAWLCRTFPNHYP